MDEKTSGLRQTLFPGLRYVDAPKAIAWLEKAFGFKRQFVVDNPDGTIAHAELAFEGAVVMLGSYREDMFRYKMPKDVGGVTQAAYLYVADVDAHFAMAKAKGAEIVMEPFDTEYGSRDYSARDLEGHLWHFGTYLPGASNHG